MWGNKNTINKTSAGRPSRDDRQRAGQAKTAPARVAREPAKKLRKLDKAPKAARAVKATRKEKAARGRQAVPPPKAVREEKPVADGLGRGDGLPAPGGLLFPGGLHGTRGLRRLVQLSQLLRGLPRHPRRRGLCLPGALTVVPGGPAGRRLVDGVLVTPHVPLSLIHISEPTRLLSISYAVFCLKKKKKKTKTPQKKLNIEKTKNNTIKHSKHL